MQHSLKIIKFKHDSLLNTFFSCTEYYQLSFLESEATAFTLFSQYVIVSDTIECSIRLGFFQYNSSHL